MESISKFVKESVSHGKRRQGFPRDLRVDSALDWLDAHGFRRIYSDVEFGLMDSFIYGQTNDDKDLVYFVGRCKAINEHWILFGNRNVMMFIRLQPDTSKSTDDSFRMHRLKPTMRTVRYQTDEPDKFFDEIDHLWKTEWN